ncbi:MAG: heme-binding domain-containing protein [Chitinophagaceae bacterium]
MIKKIGIGLLICLIIIQFIRPTKNINTVDTSKQITAVAAVPENVNAILKKACNDCHSNNTNYPWYSNIQPVYFWLNNHITEGKREINFDEFASYRLRKQYHKMEELIEQVKEGEMPLSSYTWIHKDAVLTDAEKTTLTGWAQGVMDSMKAHYPIDSLVKKKS